MKRNELRALGMTPEQIDAVMQMNGNDVNRLKADTVTKSSKEAQRLRESCVVLLELLDSPEAIRAVCCTLPACTVSRSAGSRRRASSEGKDNLHPRAGKRRTGRAGCLARNVSGGEGT